MKEKEKKKCDECGKEIAEDYLPSNFCQQCVEEYFEKTQRSCERVKYFEGK